MTFLQLLAYAAVLVFVLAVLVKIVRYATTPIHMRWELYPVAHEKGRASYGGSVFEEFEWWDKPIEKDRLNELKEMFEEILLLKGVFRNNRKLWFSSFPFHLGLYTATAWLGLLVFGAVLDLCGADVSAGAGAFGTFLVRVTSIAGYAGLALTAAGAAGLLITRLASPELKKFNTPMEYFNLAFTGTATLYALLASAAADPSFAAQRGFTAALLSLGPAGDLAIPAAVKIEIALGMLLVAYIPLTRMSHFVAKYFLYHDVRWEDEPNRRGGRIEARVKSALDYGVSWDGKHIQRGKKWGEVITEIKE